MTVFEQAIQHTIEKCEFSRCANQKLRMNRSNVRPSSGIDGFSKQKGVAMQTERGQLELEIVYTSGSKRKNDLLDVLAMIHQFVGLT